MVHMVDGLIPPKPPAHDTAITSALKEKKGSVDTLSAISLERGHLKDLVIDLDTILEDTGSITLDAETSSYPEVRAVVSDLDDPAIPISTFRMWLLGIIFTILGSGINQFFSLRYPSVHIVALVAELIAYPCGVFLARVLPIYAISLGPLGNWCVNPDHHFNIKEHAIITIMTNVSFGQGGADSTNIIQAAKAFYSFDIKPGFSILVVLCCQTLGFGVAGLAARWLVEPASIIWPVSSTN